MRKIKYPQIFGCTNEDQKLALDVVNQQIRRFFVQNPAVVAWQEPYMPTENVEISKKTNPDGEVVYVVKFVMTVEEEIEDQKP